MACERPKDVGYFPPPHWTHEQLAQAARERGIVANISPSQVGRILKKGGRPTVYRVPRYSVNPSIGYFPKSRIGPHLMNGWPFYP